MADRYDIPPDEGELLPNKLDLSNRGAIDEEEVAGFLKAELDAIDELDSDTVFSLDYLYGLHREALGHLYDFAGRLRTVDMSKNGFMFAASRFLPQTMDVFEREYLDALNVREWNDVGPLVEHLAELHAELLYIHPFREGNGRIIRLYTKLVFLAKTGDELEFELITKDNNFARYVAAVQQASRKEYELMKELFREMRA